MKKLIYTTSAIVVLMLMSFISPQKAKVVRLENGNYQLQNFKFEKGDAKKLQEMAEEMADWLTPKEDGEIRKEDKERPNFEDFLTIYEGKQGVRHYIGTALENNFTFVSKEVYEKAITDFIYSEKGEFNANDLARFQQDIDAIMQNYLNN